MLFRENTNVALTRGDAETFLILFAHGEIYVPGLLKVGRCRKMHDYGKLLTVLRFQEWILGVPRPPEIESKIVCQGACYQGEYQKLP